MKLNIRFLLALITAAAALGLSSCQNSRPASQMQDHSQMKGNMSGMDHSKMKM